MLVINQLSAGYGPVNVLTNIDLTVADGESVSIIGANGAGKSTLVRAICGLLPTSSGTISKDGEEIQTLPPYRRARLGIAPVLEGRHLFGELSLEANLKLAADQGGSRKSSLEFTIAEIFDLFPFMASRRTAPVELLSGGEQQMVAIGRALLLKPDLLILDEPSTGLAPKVVRDIVRVISTLRQRGMSLLLIEQNVAVALESSDRAYVLSLGKVVDHIEGERWSLEATGETLTRAYLGAH